MSDNDYYTLAEAAARLGEGGEWELRRSALGRAATLYGRRRRADGSLKLAHEPIPIGDLVDLYPGGRLRFHLETNSVEANAAFGLHGASQERLQNLTSDDAKFSGAAFAEFEQLVEESWGWGEVKVSIDEVNALARSLNGRITTKINAETDCFKWLCEKMQANPDRPEPKPLCRGEAEKAFEQLGVLAFNRAWTAAIHETGAVAWSGPGPRKHREGPV
jgi:hypothetical protein